jgi:predicted transcriptional regulator
VLAGSVRAPLTAILLLFELTHDYRIVLPLMAAVGLSIWLVEYLHPQVVIDNSTQSEFTANSSELNIAPTLTVADAMTTSPLQLADELALLTAGQELILHRAHGALVVDQAQHLIGILTLQDVNRTLLKAKSETEGQSLLHQPIRTICTTKLVYAYPDEALTEATDRMKTRGLQQLPVVQRDQSEQVVGLLTQEGIALADSIARTRDLLQRQLNEQLPLPLTQGSESSEVEAAYLQDRA